MVEEEYDILPNRTFTNQKADEVYDELPNRNVYDMPRGIKLRLVLHRKYLGNILYYYL